MNLEDHLGDIIRKQRAMTGVSAADAARAAGLSEADFSALEQSGNVAGKIKFPELAVLLQLKPPKLESISQGLVPFKKDFSAWRELRALTTKYDGMDVR